MHEQGGHLYDRITLHSFKIQHVCVASTRRERGKMGGKKRSYRK